MMANQQAGAQNQTAQEVANMIRSIELTEAERIARDEAAIKAARERGAAAGQNSLPPPQNNPGSAAAAGNAGAPAEE